MESVPEVQRNVADAFASRVPSPRRLPVKVVLPVRRVQSDSSSSNTASYRSVIVNTLSAEIVPPKEPFAGLRSQFPSIWKLPE